MPVEQDLKTILSEYDQKRFIYKRFGGEVESLIRKLISPTLNTHQINHRLKEKESLENKIIKKEYKYSTLSEVTDVTGVRIVCYFEDDIDKIVSLFNKEFDSDLEHSVDKRQTEIDKFGYRSVHYVGSINAARLQLSEYREFQGLKFELQIRSILQHSWAEIEHDIGYKGVSEIPSTAKRTFHRVAALLEQADIEFVKLRQEIASYETNVQQQLVSKKVEIPIDKAAIIAFIKESKVLYRLEKAIENKTCERRTENDISNDIMEIAVPILKKKGITTLQELEDALLRSESKILQWSIESYHSYQDDEKPKGFNPGASILRLRSILEGISANYMERSKNT